MGKVLDIASSILKDWVALVLLGLGITFSPHVYIGGLFLAFAGAAISRAMERDHAIKCGKELDKETPQRFWVVVTTSFFVSTLVAIAVHAYFPNWSVQVVMAASGFASRRIVVLAMSVTDNISKKGDTLADRIVDRVFPDPNQNRKSNDEDNTHG